MKKALCGALLAAVVISLFALSSCGGIVSGQGILYTSIEKVNTVTSLISDIGRYKAFCETVSYFDGDEKSFEYSLYTEKAEGDLFVYNVLERVGDYRLMAQEGEIYTEKNGEICAVLQLDSSYYAYVSEYLDKEFPLDGGERYQLSSKTNGDLINVTYYADVTPAFYTVAKDFGINIGDRVISEYVLDETFTIHSVEYSVDGKLLARRTFDYYTEIPDGTWDKVPSLDDTVSVSLYIGEREEPLVYTVPRGYYVGIDSRKAAYEYYYDRDMTERFVFDKEKINDNLIVYAKPVK